jgi:sec-independent protein translocase protein TatC
MATTLRPIRPEDRLSLVEHLDELRKRLIISVVVFAACFGLCLWQGDLILDVVNRPLERTAFKNDKKESKDPFERTAAFQAQLRKSAMASAANFDSLASAADDSATRRNYQELATQYRVLARSVPPREARRPVTLGVGEPFTATVRVAAYAALLIALPILLFQAYAFVLPAFSREERNIALPLMTMVPFLFIAGVLFAYFMILPNAIDFLQNFNDDNFDILLQAKDYYRFAIMLMIVMGVCFQVPVGILAFTRLGIVSVAQLRRSRRYTIIGIAVVAMLLPGQDPVTMLSLMAPLYVLFEGSILLASLIERRAKKRVADDPDDPDDLEA